MRLLRLARFRLHCTHPFIHNITEEDISAIDPVAELGLVWFKGTCTSCGRAVNWTEEV